MRIVFIEDYPRTDGAVLNYLTQAGNQILYLHSNEFSESRIELFHAEVIVLDMLLRHASGFELCRKIRRATPLYRHSILACMSASEDRERDHALHQGADDFLAKPFRLGELVEKLERLQKLNECAHALHPETGLPHVEQFKKHLCHRMAKRQTMAFCSFELGGLHACQERYGREVANAAIEQAAAALADVATAQQVPFASLGYLGGAFLGAMVELAQEQDFCRNVAWSVALHEKHGHYADLRLLTRVVHTRPNASCSPTDAFANLHGLIQAVPLCEHGEYFSDRRGA